MNVTIDYELKVSLAIEFDDLDGAIQGMTIADERPENGIHTVIVNEMWDIQDMITKEVDERILQDSIDKQESRREA